MIGELAFRNSTMCASRVISCTAICRKRAVAPGSKFTTKGGSSSTNCAGSLGFASSLTAFTGLPFLPSLLSVAACSGFLPKKNHAPVPAPPSSTTAAAITSSSFFRDFGGGAASAAEGAGSAMFDAPMHGSVSDPENEGAIDVPRLTAARQHHDL